MDNHEDGENNENNSGEDVNNSDLSDEEVQNEICLWTDRGIKKDDAIKLVKNDITYQLIDNLMETDLEDIQVCRGTIIKIRAIQKKLTSHHTFNNNNNNNNYNKVVSEDRSVMKPSDLPFYKGNHSKQFPTQRNSFDALN